VLRLPAQRRSPEPCAAKALPEPPEPRRIRRCRRQTRQTAEKDGPSLWELKARILAGQTDEEIGALCALAPETVHWFEALHFCVRDRLQARDWIAKVIGPGLLCGFTREEMTKIWMALAYHGGPLVLDLVMALTSPDLAYKKRRTKKYPASTLRSADLLIKTLMIPPNAALQRIGALYGSVRRVEKSAKPTRTPKCVARHFEEIHDPLDSDRLTTTNAAPMRASLL
jgi:hypothetical protein